MFLVTDTRLYNPLFGPSVRPSVGNKVLFRGFPLLPTRPRLMLPCIRPCSNAIQCRFSSPLNRTPCRQYRCWCLAVAILSYMQLNSVSEQNQNCSTLQAIFIQALSYSRKQLLLSFSVGDSCHYWFIHSHITQRNKIQVDFR